MTTEPSAPPPGPGRAMPRRARAYWLGRRKYGPTFALQQQLAEARRSARVGDVVLLLEHEPVITLGRNASRDNVLFDAATLAARGVELWPTSRGGDVTYHGPGQLVGYPILDLSPDRRDVRKYVRSLAELMILLAREYGVEAGTVDGMIGSWADAAAPQRWAGQAWADQPVKIGAIGVRLSRWITMHGFALNVCTDLSAFELIVPCGISGYGVASLASLTGEPPAVKAVADASLPCLWRAMQLRIARLEDLSTLPTAELADAILGADGPAAALSHA